MAFFALIHGGAHGGWCWEELTPELERLGHGWSAPDLPYDEPAGASRWADTVAATIPDDAGDVVVVGHSLGGLAVPLVAVRRPVRRLVFLAAVVPVPGRTFLEVLADEPDTLTIPGAADLGSEGFALELDDADGGAAAVLPWAFARDAFYQDLPEDQARRAWRRLRLQGLGSFEERCPLDAWPDVPSTYIAMADDRAVSPAWSRRVATGRLGAEELIVLGGGHSPFYGRPGELADVLDRVARG
jgi:pimeloyl-ACP methyl ester carboxylesterase